jgi:hypothetical protein
MRRFALTVFLFVLPVCLADEIADSRLLQREAIEAHRGGREDVFLAKIQAAAALRPQHPSLQYQLATALAVNGHPDDALSTLERVASMGLIYKPETAREFASLKDSPRFRSVNERFAANAQRQGTPSAAFTIDQPGLIAEGMAYDAKTKRFFVSSVRTRSIYEIDGDGRARPFITGVSGGVFGMAVDPRKRTLWAATSSLPQVEGFQKSDEGRAAVIRIDLAHGAITATLRANDNEKHTFGDVAVTPDGQVLVSDSASPVIFRVEGDHLAPFIRGPFASTQGIAATATHLYVADYARGIYAVNRRTKAIELLPVPNDVSLLGVDGLYAARPGVLVATQNGTNPNRVIRIALSADGRRVDRVDTLAANDPAMSDLTLGVIADGQLYFNANAQWDAWGDDGAMAKDAKLEPLRVLRVAF